MILLFNEGKHHLLKARWFLSHFRVCVFMHARPDKHNMCCYSFPILSLSFSTLGIHIKQLGPFCFGFGYYEFLFSFFFFFFFLGKPVENKV